MPVAELLHAAYPHQIPRNVLHAVRMCSLLVPVHMTREHFSWVYRIWTGVSVYTQEKCSRVAATAFRPSLTAIPAVPVQRTLRTKLL